MSHSDIHVKTESGENSIQTTRFARIGYPSDPIRNKTFTEGLAATNRTLATAADSGRWAA